MLELMISSVILSLVLGTVMMILTTTQRDYLSQRQLMEVPDEYPPWRWTTWSG